MYEYRARCVRVIDGDSVVLAVDMGFRLTFEDSFRLAGINTPELNSSDPAERERAKAAAAFLRERIEGQPLTVRTDKAREKYGRWLATVYVGEECVNDALVDAGHAVAYSGGKR